MAPRGRLQPVFVHRIVDEARPLTLRDVKQLFAHCFILTVPFWKSASWVWRKVILQCVTSPLPSSIPSRAS